MLAVATWAVILAAMGAIGLVTLLVVALGRASARADAEEDRLIAQRKQAIAAEALLEPREHEPSR